MKTSLARGLTLIPATALIVTQVIGTGVFVKARVMTCNVGTPWMVCWPTSLPAILTLGGALTFAELSAMMPRAGVNTISWVPHLGEFGPFFSGGWRHWWMGREVWPRSPSYSLFSRMIFWEEP